MFRLLDSAGRIILFAFAAFIYCLITWPLWTICILGALFLIGWYGHNEEQKQLRYADVRALSPTQYENHCALLLQDAGWQVKTTPMNDQGVDVLAELRGVRAAVQCKKYTSRVGNKAVQEITAGKAHYGAHVAVVVCPMGYTRSAIELARTNGVLLIHHSQLSGLDKLARIP